MAYVRAVRPLGTPQVTPAVRTVWQVRVGDRWVTVPTMVAARWAVGERPVRLVDRPIVEGDR